MIDSFWGCWIAEEYTCLQLYLSFIVSNARSVYYPIDAYA